MEVKGKYRLLVVRTKFLKESLQITNEIFEEAYKLFTEDLKEFTGANKVKEEEKQEEKSQDQKTSPPGEYHNGETDGERVEVKKEEKDSNLKQVFKKIARLIHPDKLASKPEFEREYKGALFEKARISLENNDYYGIVEVAEELGIEPPEPTQDQIDLMKETNQKLEGEIDEIKGSIIWSWYHGNGDQRFELMEKYVEHLKKKHNIGP